HRHPVGVNNGSGVDQQRLPRTDKQKKEIPFGAHTKILPKDKRLRLISVDLERRLRVRLAVLRAGVPADAHRTGDDLRLQGGRRNRNREPSRWYECHSNGTGEMY